MDHVTETEMREFFARIVNTVVSLSETAKQVEALQANVSELGNRLDALTQENQSLRQSEAEAHELIKVSEASEAKARAERDEAESKVRHYQDVMVARDARVSELEQQYAESQRRVAQLEGEVTQTGNRLMQVIDERDRLEHDLGTVTSERDSATAARDKAEASLAAIRRHLGIPVTQGVAPTPSDHPQGDFPRAVSSW